MNSRKLKQKYVRYTSIVTTVAQRKDRKLTKQLLENGSMVLAIFSQPKLLTSGILQGSILDPKLFSLYLKSVGDVIMGNNFAYHIYADDIQIYLTIISAEDLSSKISKYLNDVMSYINSSKLKLNDEKTILIFFASPRMTLYL